MLLIGVGRETDPAEKRIALLPVSVEKLVKKGLKVWIEAGLGEFLNIPDSDYLEAGAQIKDRTAVFTSADILFRLDKPDADEIALIKPNALRIGFLDPFRHPGLIHALAKKGITTISLEMIPRTTLAQKMDALSSQANLAGYVAVITAAEKSNRIFPMMMTPAGTIPPLHVFVIGAGVAGLQAIATAKRLGARVQAFDTRAVVEDQVKSLGAKFVKIDLGETGQTKDGYAKTLTAQQLEKQRQGMAKVCATSDIVITTAQIFGQKAPLIISKDMIAGMKPGSIIVDMAVETGGNVEGSAIDKETDFNGIKILGFSHLPSRVALSASLMFSNNVTNFIEHYWDAESKTLKFNLDDEILNGCVLTFEGKLRKEL